MRAIVLTDFQGPSSLKLVQVDTPRAGAGEALVKVEAVGLHQADVEVAYGRLARPPLPRVPGRDFAGTVVAGPKEWLDRRVFGTGGELGRTVSGTLAGCVLVPIAGLVEVPESITLSQAGCLGMSAVAAWRALFHAAGLRAGQTLVVIGATGGVGSVAVQLGRWTGATVIACVRTERQAAAARELGARHVVSGPLKSIPDRVSELAGPAMASAVLDATGGAALHAALRCAGLGGRVVQIASSPGTGVSLRADELGESERSLHSVNPLRVDAAASAAVLREMLPAVHSGALTPGPIALEVPLSEAGAALAKVEAGAGGRAVVLAQR